MRTLRSKYLSDIKIDESHYKADFIILDKYQAFSSEILRLALLGLAIFGYLLTDVIFKFTDDQKKFVFVDSFRSSSFLFAVGALVLLFAALCALGHRYYSTDCMTHYIRRFRLRVKITEKRKEESELNAKLAMIRMPGNQESPDADKLEKEIAETGKKIRGLENTISVENVSFERDLVKCKWLLIFAGLLLISGMILMVSGLGKTLMAI
jgi:signal transduction histidine kinase